MAKPRPCAYKVFLPVTPSVFAGLFLKNGVVFLLRHFLFFFFSLSQTGVRLVQTSVRRSFSTCLTEAV